MVEKPDKCAHAPCRCPRPAGGDYCSDYCAQGDDPEIICGCGHPECQAMLSAAALVEQGELNLINFIPN